jgi:hypothetical protein
MANELWANLYLQRESNINGHSVFHYLISTSIGNIHIVEYEDKGMELKRFIIEEDNDKAEQKYNLCCKYIIKNF